MDILALQIKMEFTTLRIISGEENYLEERKNVCFCLHSTQMKQFMHGYNYAEFGKLLFLSSFGCTHRIGRSRYTPIPV